MPLTIPSQDDIAGKYLEEISNQLPDADVYADSDYRVRANATASTLWGLYQYAAWALRQALRTRRIRSIWRCMPGSAA